MSICQLINDEITKIKEYPVPDPNNLKPEEYQLHLEELTNRVAQLKQLKKLLALQKGFGGVDKYIADNDQQLETIEEVLNLITVREQENITEATLIFDGNLNLNGITESNKAKEILRNIQIVTGFLSLSSLTSAKGLKLPSSVTGDLDLNSLTSAEGLVLPTSIGGGLDLRWLTSAEGLVLPASLGGGLYLNGLTSAKGLVLPSSVSGGLDLSGLTSAEGLVLPTSIDGRLNLRDLTSLDGLVLPAEYLGPLYLPERLRSDAEQDLRLAGVTIRYN